MNPITREEMYLAAAAGYDVTPPEPITRKEKFLAKLAGMEVETPAVFTRQERFLDEAAVALSRSVIEPLEVTENGTYTAPEGVDGYSPVTVNVPAPEINLQDKTITENGTYTADSGFDGLGSVEVNVAASGNTATIKKGTVSSVKHKGADYTVNHDLGVVPDVIMIIAKSPSIDDTFSTSGNGLISIVACPDTNTVLAFRHGFLTYLNDGIVKHSDRTSSMYGSGFYGLSATETTFTIQKPLSGVDYCWTAIAGLV